MDRTAMFNTTVSAAAHRRDEKEFGEQIHRNLQVLAQHQAPSDELRRLLSDDMFAKPNTTAFTHVAHFLFTLIDAREFRRLFHWPCRDKAAESNFRTVSVTLMNTLIQRHQMPLDPIKMHNVVLPGGLKFMRILFEFTMLAMRTVADKHAAVKSCNVHIEVEARRSYQKYARVFFQKLDISLQKIQSHHQAIQAVITQIDPTNTATDDKALETWQAQLERVFEHQLAPAARCVTQFAEFCDQLNDRVQHVVGGRHKENVAVDRDELKACGERLMRMLPSNDDSGGIGGLVTQMCVNNEFNFAVILAVFEALLPSIAARLDGITYRYIDTEVAVMEREILDQLSTEVLSVKERSDRLLRQHTDWFERAHQEYPFAYTDSMSSEITGDTTTAAPVVQLDMRTRFLSTPAVRVKSMQDSVRNNIFMTSRLPFVFEDNTMVRPAAAAANAVDGKALLETTIKGLNKTGTPSRNTSLNVSKRGGLSMLSRVRDLCNAKADAQWRSNATHAQTTGTEVVLGGGGGCPSPRSPSLAAKMRSTAVARLAALKQASSAIVVAAHSSPRSQQQSTPLHTPNVRGSTSRTTTSTMIFTENLFESHTTTTTTLQPDSYVLHHQRCQTTNQVIHLQSADRGARHDFRKSPTGLFILTGDLAEPSPCAVQPPLVTVQPPSPSNGGTVVKLPTADAEGSVGVANTPRSAHTSCSSDASLAAITARKIIFSPDGVDDGDGGGGDDTVAATTPVTVVKAKRTSEIGALEARKLGEESLFNVSDSVLHISM